MRTIKKALEEGRRVHEQELKNKPGKVKVGKGHPVDRQTPASVGRVNAL